MLENLRRSWWPHSLELNVISVAHDTKMGLPNQSGGIEGTSIKENKRSLSGNQPSWQTDGRTAGSSQISEEAGRGLLVASLGWNELWNLPVH